VTQKVLICPKCKMSMDNGAVHGTEGMVWTADVAVSDASMWAKAKQRRRSRRTVTALRCSSCGLLELYARDPDPKA
jgi:hypothetical protein